MQYAHKRDVIISKILGRFQENKSKNQQILSKNRTKMDSPSPLKYRGQTQKMRGIKMWNLLTLLNTENLIVVSNKSFKQN